MQPYLLIFRSSIYDTRMQGYTRNKFFYTAPNSPVYYLRQRKVVVILNQ